jgi:hypothetical protein
MKRTEYMYTVYIHIEFALNEVKNTLTRTKGR